MDRFTTEKLQAANVLLSYLKNSSVEASLRGADVLVNQRVIVLGAGYDDIARQIDISDLRSNKLTRLQVAINKFLQYAQVDANIQIEVRKGSVKRSNITDNFEAILFREKTFKNSPNPSNELLLKWRKVADQHACAAYNRYARHLNSFGYEQGDFKSIALVHLCTFLHKYMTGDDLTDGRNLHRFMKQRMNENAHKVIKKSVRCVADTSQRLTSSATEGRYENEYC